MHPLSLLFYAILLILSSLLARAHAADVIVLGTNEEQVGAWAERFRPALSPGLSLSAMLIDQEPLLPRCVGARLVLAQGEIAAAAALRACPQTRVWAHGLCARCLRLLHHQAPDRLSGISTDVPLERQLALLKALSPRPRVVALPISSGAEGLAQNARTALEKSGFKALIVVSDPDEQPLRPLREVLDEVDAVLALPDPKLFHPGLLKHWLLMTLREGVPMLGGLGARDVERGIVAAMVQPPDAVMEHTLALLPQLLAGPLPAPLGLPVAELRFNPFMLERLRLKLDTEGLKP